MFLKDGLQRDAHGPTHPRATSTVRFVALPTSGTWSPHLASLVLGLLIRACDQGSTLLLTRVEAGPGLVS
jgi:hypothetical protein